jgi:K+-sensing histidine kinase KdpD
VDQHDGRIGVANREPGGAMFRVELPAAAPPPG